MDKELDFWICQSLGIPNHELAEEDLHKVLMYHFPDMEVCNDPEIVKNTGCAYIKLNKADPNDRAILISTPTNEKVKLVLYYINIVIAKAIRNKESQIHICKIL